jgi:beta-1,4-mannosyltransferase
MAERPHTRRRLRVVGWPAFKTWRNPYNTALYESLRALGVEVDDYSIGRFLFGDFDVLHLHWPNFNVPHRRHSVVGFLRIFVHVVFVPLALVAARLRGGKIVWTIHNLQSHDSRWPRLATAYDTMLVRLIDAHISLSAAGRAEAEAKFPRLRRLPGFVIPHGHYRDAYGPRIDRGEARDRLGIPRDSRVALSFGAIWRYKRVSTLITAFEECADQDILFVAGQTFDAMIRDEVQALAGRSHHTRLLLRFVPVTDVPVFFSAADLIVNAGNTFLNSGSLILALSFGIPVLARDTGTTRELQDVFGERLVHLYCGELTGVTIRSTLDQVAGRIEEVPPRAFEELGWERIGKLTLDAYMQLATKIRPRSPAPPSRD